ncbi:hypothetical protein GGR58DRAFT_504738 [Xylaria digitata]|nr:hypothetical protein GGR58DRAFT_504738 [Xylaria digitata]
MANDTTAKYDNGSSPSEYFSPRSNVHKPTGTNLDPIVLDDDSGDDTAHKKESWARRKRRPTPYKRRRTSFGADDTNGEFIPPRSFTEILQYESANEEITRLNDKIKSLRAESSRLEATALENTRMAEEIATLSTTLDATKKSVEELTVFKARFEESEIERDNLREELKLKNAEAMVARESLRAELIAERQLRQAQETELTETRERLQNSQNALQSAKNEADLARRHMKKAREVRNELYEQSLDGNRTIAELESAYKKLSSELSTVKFNLTTTEMGLSATSEALSKAQTRILDLESQLGELEQERASSKDRIVELERQVSKQEEARATIESRIVELEHDKAMLEDNTIKLVAAAAKEGKKRSLQSSLSRTKKAHEAMRLDKDKLQQERKEVIGERDDIYRRLNNLEVKNLEDTKVKENQIVELAVTKQKFSRASLDLQEAQQQIKEMEDHMEKCPMARKPKEFREYYGRKIELVEDSIEENRQSMVSWITQAD